MTNLQPQPAPGKPRRNASSPKALGIVKPPGGAAGTPAWNYQFDAAPQELRRSYTLSDEAFRLSCLLVNECRFRSSGRRSTTHTNDWLMEQCGWYSIRPDGTKCYNEKKLLRAFKELEAAGIVRRDLKLEGEKRRGAINWTWTPTETIAPETFAPIGSPDRGIESEADDLDLQIGGSRSPDRGIETSDGPPIQGIVGSPDRGNSQESSQELHSKESPKPPHVGFGGEERPSSTPTPPSPGAKSEPPPAGDGGGPVETPGGVYFPTGRSSAALDQGGGEPDGGFEGEDFDEEDVEAAQRARVRDLARAIARRDGRSVVSETDEARALETFQAPPVQIHLEGRDQARALKGMMAEAVRVPSARSAGYRTTPEQASAASAWNALWRAWHKAGEVGPIPPWTEAGVPMPESVRTKFREHERSHSPDAG